MAKKTSKCRYCGKTVPVQPNQLQKPHMIGAQRCIGGGQPSEGYKPPKYRSRLKPKRPLDFEAI